MASLGAGPQQRRSPIAVLHGDRWLPITAAAGLALTAAALTVPHDPVMVDRPRRAVTAQPGEPAVGGAPRQERAEHQPSRDAVAQDAAQSVDYLPHWVGPFASAFGIRREERAKSDPLSIGQRGGGKREPRMARSGSGPARDLVDHVLEKSAAKARDFHVRRIPGFITDDLVVSCSLLWNIPLALVAHHGG